MFFQKKTINLVSIAKNMKIYSRVWEKGTKIGILVKNCHILAVFGQKSTNFKFSSKNEKHCILSFLDVQLHAINYSAVLAVEPERTDGRE